MELRHLRCFVAVADHEQVSAAAQAMHLAQPAISQTIRQLERELGAPLFERHPRGLRLTEAGEALLPYARAALDNSELAVEAVRACVRERQRAIRVGFLPPLTSLGTKLIAAFESDQPGMKVSVRQLGFAHHLDALSSHEVDVALVWEAMDRPPEGVTLQELVQEPRVVCLASSHPLASRGEVSFYEVQDEPIIRLSDDFPPAVNDFIHLTAWRQSPARLTDQVPGSWEEGVWMIATGRAICTGPLSLAEALARPGIVTIPLRDVEPVTIAIAARSDDHRASVHAFTRTALKAVREPAAATAGGAARRRSS
jgi:DNA-binding transcriptional LysR family regulator